MSSAPDSSSLQPILERHYRGVREDPTWLPRIEQALRVASQRPDQTLQEVLDQQLGTDWRVQLPKRYQIHMAWQQIAFERWHDKAPLAGAVGREFARLLPLTIALSITDERYLAPGNHPLHQTLDFLFEASIGWDSSLEHSGDALRRLLRDAIDAMLHAFSEQRGDLAAICEHVNRAAHGYIERRERNLTRLADAERSQLRAAGVRNIAAQELNGLLRRFRAPSFLGEFIKGPWYESLQLCLLRHGSHSQDWQQQLRLTESLLEQFQEHSEPAQSDGDEPQQGTKWTEQLSEQLRRALLATSAEESAVVEAMSPVEFTLLRILQNSPLPLENIPPISAAGDEAGTEVSSALLDSIRTLREGDWLLLSADPGAPRTRAAIAARLEDEQEILLGNQLGNKIGTRSFAQLAYMMTTGRARKLPSRYVYSSLLREAALRLPEPALEHAPERAPEPALEHAPERAPEPALEPAPEPAPERAPEPMPEPTSEPMPKLASESEPPTGKALKLRARMHAEDRPLFDRGRARPSIAVLGEQLPITMGSWIGFHEDEVATLGKLAVHDRERDVFMFVNRSGLKLRECSRAELEHLYTEGALELLQVKSDFKAVVGRIQQYLQQISEPGEG